MAVIGTRLAIRAPAPPPTTTPPLIRASVIISSAPDVPSVSRVTPTARAMPIMPSVLPRRLVSGLDKPLSERMNRTPAAR
ncbi:hypothetical protein D3C86_1904200 [compost metagenome]